MLRHLICRIILTVICCLSLTQSSPAGPPPTAKGALQLKPVQSGVLYDTPAGSDLDNCTIKNEEIQGASTWIVRSADGSTLRQFSDTDEDNVVDTWSYFRNGLEVYRDIDANYNGKADQYRWFHGAGMRWGLDRNEDGKIDSWKLISAEEVAEEIVSAAQSNNLQKFEALMLTDEELNRLELGKELKNQISSRIQEASAKFSKLITSKKLGSETEFRDFGGIKPGMVPAGTRDSKKDLLVYENVWAMVRVGEDFEQLQIGTLINIKGAWKLVDCPTVGDATELASIFYGPSSDSPSNAGMNLAVGSAPTEKMQEILASLEKLDQQLMQAQGKQKATLNNQRANLLLQLANASANSAERVQWLRQLADMVSAATQDGSFPRGPAYLNALEKKLAKEGQSEDLLSYIEFQRMLAEYYGVTLVDPKVDHAKAHSQWLKDLEAFVKAHPKSDNSAEALRQLAMGSEISGDDEQAVKWYQQVIKQHSNSIHAPLARGAVVRLTSVGKPIRLQGQTTSGRKFDLSKLRGKAVVIQYWTSSSDVSKSDHAVLGNLYKKYGGGRGLEVIGVNLDYSQEELVAYLKSNRLPWPQLYEKGGFDSRFAREMGVITVPLMMLVGPDGKVISHNIQAAEIEEAIKKLQTRQARKLK